MSEKDVGQPLLTTVRGSNSRPSGPDLCLCSPCRGRPIGRHGPSNGVDLIVFDSSVIRVAVISNREVRGDNERRTDAAGLVVSLHRRTVEANHRTGAHACFHFSVKAISCICPRAAESALDD
jgi:hypothetical protein